MDIRYQRGKIYTIGCHDDDTKIYVGSTIETLSTRLAKHRCDSKVDRGKNIILYKTVNSNWGDWYIELYEIYACNSKEELCKREGEIIRLIATLNKNITGRTHKEYYEDNKEKSKEKYENNKEIILEKAKEYYEDNKEKKLEYQKEYYENNRDEIIQKEKEKVICQCGCKVIKYFLTKHQKTKKHQLLMEQKLIV